MSGKQAHPEETAMAENSSFDFETRIVMLNSGYEMPIYGIGTYSNNANGAIVKKRLTETLISANIVYRKKVLP